MNPFYQMFKKVTSSSHYNQMMRYVAPLNDHFGINHFWYYRISFSGHYTYLGTHSGWNEFCFENPLILSHFPCLRDPHTLQSGIQLMKASANTVYQTLLKTAWDQFHINFNINLLNRTPDGVVAFGFATRFNDVQAEERLLNELPLLRNFTEAFQERHQQLFRLLDDNQVDLSSEFGSVFYERTSSLAIPRERNMFLKKMGLESIHTLTPREIDILKFVSNGYPATYIANQLQLSKRTVENYIATIKDKLDCHSKVELIQKAQEILLLRNEIPKRPNL